MNIFGQIWKELNFYWSNLKEAEISLVRIISLVIGQIKLFWKQQIYFTIWAYSRPYVVHVLAMLGVDLIQSYEKIQKVLSTLS